MDTYIYSDSPLMINVDSMDRNGLIESAYRMLEGTIDDNGNELTTTMTDNPMFNN